MDGMVGARLYTPAVRGAADLPIENPGMKAGKICEFMVSTIPCKKALKTKENHTL